MLRIEAPSAQPEKGGLLAHITPSTDIDGFAFEYGAQFESVLPSGLQPVPGPGEEKQFGTLDKKEFQPFSVYSGIKGKLVDDHDLAAKRLERSVEGGLGRAIEAGAQRLLLNPNGEDIAGTPITNPRLALGILEQWGAENIGTQVMIHTDRKGAAMLRDLKGDDGKLFTKQGNLVANGGGYIATGPGGVEAAQNQAWVYVSQVPTVYRTETMTTVGRELIRNDFHILSEVRVLPIIEGQVAAVLLEG